MLKINLSPVRADRSQHVALWVAPVLTVDSIEYDLSLLPDGATATHEVLGAVSRDGSNYELTLKLYHGANAPYATRFPEPLTVIADGPVEFPPYNEEVI